MKGVAYRGCCKTIFFFKALLAIVLGAAALGVQGYLVYLRFTTAPKPLPPVGFPDLGSADAPKCFYNPSRGRARLEPPESSFFFGFSPQWVNGDLPLDVASRIGYRPPLFNSFVSMNATSFQADIIEWNCQLIGELGGVLELTLMPTIRADEIPDSFYPTFAQFMRKMNSKYGVAVLLRFMHEMNGYWMTYGQQPTAQKKAWANLSRNIRAQTNMTALVWSPNVSAPYRQVTAATREAEGISQEDFELLDTDNNQVLDNNDDPYSPYFPDNGDDIIDWIGISTYNYARDNNNKVPVVPGDFLYDPTTVATLFRTGHTFYPTYVEAKKKPFILSETGAPIESNIDGQPQLISTPYTSDDEVKIKQSFWRAIFQGSINYQAPMPRMKAAVWFEESKPETAQNKNFQVLRDFRITANPAVAAAFAKDIKAQGTNITRPSGFKFTCDGQFNIQSS
ncbi:hypothetical protein HDV03_005049 [Kappamyces sp. JEL0829]|nr:hypothetical protein HDV03_005049 [Kappamyces sp. JEL0829]